MPILIIIRLLLFLFYFPSLLGQYSYSFPPHLIQEKHENASIDHLSVFEVLLSKMPKGNILEFGLGHGTQYFLNTCREVTSVELVTPSNNQKWFQKCLSELQGNPRWNPILIVGSLALEKSDKIALQGLDPSLYDGSYLLEFKDLCDNLFAKKCYDVVFVNPGLHLRGDLINELFGRALVIVAHDTAYSDRIYGWAKISPPFDYIRLDYKQGYGTTIWIHKSQKELIKKLLPNYTEQKSEKLRIFFPEIHGELVQSMIFVCQHLGHTLVLPGKSFHPSDPKSGFKLRCGVMTCNLENLPIRCRKNVEIIENDEILQNPPDVFFINCEDVEQDILNITQNLDENKIKIAHYSGNNNVPYSSQHLKNLISADATTAYQYKMEKLHYTFWIPWIDWPSLEYIEPNLEGTINTYLGAHYLQRGFFPAKHLYEKYTSQYEKSHKFYPFVLHDWIEVSEMFAAMEKSVGTLHMKNHEGFGYTIIQSLAKGKPVFLKRSYSVGKKLMNWCIGNQTALFFDDYQEFVYVVNRYLSDKKYCVYLQNNAAKQIRRMIDNEKQALIFENFIQHLK